MSANTSSTTSSSAAPPAPVAEPPQPAAVPQPTPRDAEIERYAGRNLIVMAWYFVLLRLAWIFKTESVIIPAYLDRIVAEPALQATLRGCLPVLNRLGHSLPPLYYADRLAAAPRKKWSVVVTTLMMAVPFLALSVAWFLRLHERWSWFPYLFLALYAVFFAATGMNQLGHGTLQGKLIRPDRRGRLMGIGGISGSILAIAGAWYLLPRLLEVDASGRTEGFGGVFAVAGIGFVIAAVWMLPVVEPADGPRTPRRRGSRLGHAWRLFVEDRRFRGLAVVAMLYMTLQMIFPHYQALARTAGADDPGDLMLWVVVQNGSVGILSLVIGWIADRHGNRLSLRCLVLASALTPLVAVSLANGWLPGGVEAFWVVFLLLGLSPVGLRSFSNYALELAHPEDHPRYLSTLTLCMAVPFLFSPLLGYLVHLVGFTPVFLGTSVVVFAAWGLTFTLAEPRHEPLSPP